MQGRLLPLHLQSPQLPLLPFLGFAGGVLFLWYQILPDDDNMVGILHYLSYLYHHSRFHSLSSRPPNLHKDHKFCRITGLCFIFQKGCTYAAVTAKLSNGFATVLD
jgi:hypothetical protein